MSKSMKEYTEFTEHYITFTRNRFTQLITQHGISEHKLSTETGHSGSYINSITSGRSLPAFDEFLYLCEVLRIIPSEFFNEENKEPALINKLVNVAKELRTDEIEILINMAESLIRNKRND